MAKQSEKRHVRVELTVENHKILRLAAAVSDEAMSEFARTAVLAAATEATRHVKFSPTAKELPQRRKTRQQQHCQLIRPTGKEHGNRQEKHEEQAKRWDWPRKTPGH